MNSTPTNRENLFQQLIQCRNTINNILLTEFNYPILLDNQNTTRYTALHSSNPYPNINYSYPYTYPHNPLYIPPYPNINYFPTYPNITNPTPPMRMRNSSIPMYNSRNSMYTRQNRPTRNTRNSRHQNARNSINSLINIIESLNNLQSNSRINSTRNTNRAAAAAAAAAAATETNTINNETNSTNQQNNYSYNFIPQFNSLLNNRNYAYQNLDTVMDTSPTPNNNIYQNLDNVMDTSPSANTNYYDYNIDTSPSQNTNNQTFRDRIRQVLPELVEITLYSDGRPLNINTENLEDVPVPTNLNILRHNTEVSTYSNLDTTEDSCCICRENFQDTDIVRKINSCGHVFHLNCLDTWLERHTTCPMCRQDIRESNTPINESQNENIINPIIENIVNNETIEEID